jgi:hypothetical protein
MRSILLAVTLSTGFVMPVAAQTRPPGAVPTGMCATLMKAYDGASMDMASNFTSALADNSAPRATLRAMEDANSLSVAKMALDLMRDNRCPMPKSVPSSAYYLGPALSCATDRLKGTGGTSPPSCDRSTWERAGG